MALGAIAAGAALIATRLWPAHDPEEIEHVHETLDASHPHLAGSVPIGHGHRHSHAFVIDKHHPEWPRTA